MASSTRQFTVLRDTSGKFIALHEYVTYTGLTKVTHLTYSFTVDGRHDSTQSRQVETEMIRKYLESVLKLATVSKDSEY
jgi:hypothetical protein